MVILSTILMTLLGISGLFLIGLILLQRGRGGGLAGAFGGMGGQSAFGTKAGDVFTRITIGVASAWILLCAGSVLALHHSTGVRNKLPEKISEPLKKAAPNDAADFPGEEMPKPDGKAKDAGELPIKNEAAPKKANEAEKAQKAEGTDDGAVKTPAEAIPPSPDKQEATNDKKPADEVEPKGDGKLEGGGEKKPENAKPDPKSDEKTSEPKPE